jgi:glycosyltransferase involved in cell wall biosynthesis
MLTNQTPFPLISIVLATYNGAKFLRTQLDSVLQQDYPNLEIIVSDDNSTDDTVAIIESYQQLNTSIQLVCSNTNQGYIKNFEQGCKLAKGEYVALCDQDDQWHPQKISKLYAAIGDAALVYANSILCNEKMEPIGVTIADRVTCKDFSSPLEQAIFCRIYGHAMLIKNQFLQHIFPFPTIIPHDWWIAYTATVNGGIRYIPDQLAWYRQHSNNVFGAVGGKRNKTQEAQAALKEKQIAQERIALFYSYCPTQLSNEKSVLAKLNQYYHGSGILNSVQRMLLFFKYHPQLLASKKRSRFRQWLFCLKMFAKIV